MTLPAHDPFRGVPYLRGGGLEQPEELTTVDPDVAGEGYPLGGNVDAITGWAGEDPARRAYAVAVEQMAERPRKTVLALAD